MRRTEFGYKGGQLEEMASEMRLKEKVAIVTGGAQGIGRAISIRYAQEGAKVVIADVDSGAAKSTASEIETLGSEALVLAVDISDSSQVDRMVQETVNRFKKVDILVNNAAYTKNIPFLEFTETEWDKIIRVSLGGYFFCSQRVAREMVKHRAGKIINMSSLAPAIAHVGLSAYAAAKAGIIAMTKVVAIELSQYNINVNAISPGPIETPLMSKMVTHIRGEEKSKKMPMGWIGKPDDVAHVAVFLASEDANHITGNILSTAGGFIGSDLLPEK
jgi:3-oxoacyl-[acyl-carrier protein] reductase